MADNCSKFDALLFMPPVLKYHHQWINTYNDPPMRDESRLLQRSFVKNSNA
jgi:hypothetical protein